MGKIYRNKLLLSLYAAAILFTSAFFVQPSTVKAANFANTVNPTDDAWVKNGSYSNGAALRTYGPVGSAGEKDAFLKFDAVGVSGANINGTVNSTKLRLYITQSVTGSTTKVYAADNDWTESGLTWAARPRQTTLLVTQANPSATDVNKWVEYDVTPYISGTGTFSFKLTSDLLGDIAYDSSEGTNPPQLAINYSDSSNRVVQDVIDTGNTYINRYSSQTDVTDIGIFDVTKQPYGADPTGAADSTLAIQRAVNEARDARVAAYFPGGTYKVSDTIELVEGIIGYSYITMQGNHERWNYFDFSNMLMGPASGTRATIQLASGASGFGPSDPPKQVLNFWTRDDSTGGDPTTNKANVNFNQTISNIDLNLGGNEAAVGITMYSAQGSSISDLTITATGAYAGLGAGTGPGGSIYGVTVDGGQFGGHFDDGQNTTVINSTFKNQTVNSIYFSGRGSLMLVGDWMEDKGIDIGHTGSASPWDGNLTMVDSVVKLDSTNATAISGDRSAYINNSYFYQAGTIANLTGVTAFSGNGTGWATVNEYAGGVTVDQSPKWNPTPDGDVPTTMPNWVDGTKQTTPVSSKGADGTAPPSDIQTRHAWTATPSWQDTGVINVKSSPYNAAGDGVTDDYTAIQNAINAGAKIFLPKGDYLISQPLTLNNNTVLFGVNKNISVIRPKLTGTNSFSTPASPNPLVVSPDVASAAPMLADLKLLEPFNAYGAYLLEWQSGKDSIVKNVNFDRRNIQGSYSNMNFPLIKIQGHGGGKWYNLWNGSQTSQGADYRHLLVDGTSQPLSFYMFNFEHSNGDILAEFNDVSNVEIYQYKAEGEKTDVKFTNSNQFRVFGFGGTSTPPTGSANIEVASSTNFLLANADFQQILPGKTGAVNPSGNYRVKEAVSGGGTVQTGGWEQFVLYKQGAPHTTDPAVTLFSDDFQDGDSSGWTVSGGTWSIATGGTNKSYHQDDDTTTAKSPAGVATWTDYSVEAQIKVSSWNSTGAAGVVGRYQDGNNHYMLRYNNSTGKLALEKRIGGTVTPLDSVTIAAPSVGVYHTFKLDMNGSSLTGYLDGVLKVSATDTARSDGRMGVYTYDQKADFDNVVVK